MTSSISEASKIDELIEPLLEQHAILWYDYFIKASLLDDIQTQLEAKQLIYNVAKLDSENAKLCQSNRKILPEIFLLKMKGLLTTHNNDHNTSNHDNTNSSVLSTSTILKAWMNFLLVSQTYGTNIYSWYWKTFQAVDTVLIPSDSIEWIVKANIHSTVNNILHNVLNIPFSKNSKNVFVLKCLKSLFDQYPILRDLEYDSTLIQQCIEKLNRTSTSRSQALSIYRMFQSKIPEMAVMISLVNHIIEDRNYDLLVPFVTEILSNSLPSNSISPIVVTDDDSPTEMYDSTVEDHGLAGDTFVDYDLLLNNNEQTVLKGNTERIESNVNLDTNTTSASTSTCIKEDVNPVLDIIYDILNKLQLAGTKSSLGAAIQIATAYHLKSRRQQIKEAYDTVRIVDFVDKGRWRIAFTRVDGFYDKQKILFTELIQRNMYREAKQVQSQFPALMREYGIISDDKLIDQESYELATYLQLPNHIEKSILKVDSWNTLLEAATILTIQLDSYRIPFIDHQSKEIDSNQSNYDFKQPKPRLVVGLDSEWTDMDNMFKERNSIQTKSTSIPWNGCSIIQISTCDKVLIFDMISLCRSTERRLRTDYTIPFTSRTTINTMQSNQLITLKEGLLHLLTILFSTPDIMKVSWQFENSDIAKIRSITNDYFKSAFSHIQNMIPLHKVVYEVPSNRPFNGKSLSDACNHFLGKPLCKGERMSDWQLRPLSKRQLQYAALDAYCTLQILSSILFHPQNSTVDVDSTVVLDSMEMITNSSNTIQTEKLNKLSDKHVKQTPVDNIQLCRDQIESNPELNAMFRSLLIT